MGSITQLSPGQARLAANAAESPAASAPDLVTLVQALPWPALLVDESGVVSHFNPLMQQVVRQPGRSAGGHIRVFCPEHFAALAGDPAWLTTQSRRLVRAHADGTQRSEEVHLCRLESGACMIVVEQGEGAQADGNSMQTGRLASLGFMLASATHEISNPLTAIHSIVQILQSKRGVSIHALRQGLQNITSNVNRILAITRKLNVFARVDPEAPSRFAIDTAIEEAVVLLGYDSLGETIQVSLRKNPEMLVAGYRGQLQQVFLNILLNAAQAMHGHGSVYIATQRAGIGMIDVAIRDTGPGVAPENFRQIFEPFFSTKHQGDGTGLGLAISNEIVQEHGGSLRVENHSEGGACFHVQLPLAH